MTIVCPACGKQSAGPAGLPAASATERAPAAVPAALVCVRCGCDLTALRDIRLAAASNLQFARVALLQREWHDALALAEQSWSLVHSESSATVACLAAAALSDPPLLEQWRRRRGERGVPRLN